VKKNINCPCGNNFSFNVEEEVDLDKSPDSLENILNGSFMSYNCPSCRKKHKPEYKITILWKTKNVILEVLPELERGEFYRNKKENSSVETVIGFPEMFDRIAVLNDGLEPIIIETLKYYLLEKAEETYPDKDINAWYNEKGQAGIEFHLDGIRQDEVAVMRIPHELYEKTFEDYRKHPKNDFFSSLRIRSYLSVQNILRPDVLK
jgi:hypothetical protein